MTSPDQYGHDPIDLRKSGSTGAADRHELSGYAPGYLQDTDYPQTSGYPLNSGYPPMPGFPYPQQPGATYPPTGGYPPVPHSGAPGYPGGYLPGNDQPSFGRPYGAGYPTPRNGLGTAALVLGIIAVVLSWTIWFGVVLGVLAVCFGGAGLGRARRGEATNRGSALAGLILGIVAISLLALLVIVGIGLFAGAVSVYN